MTTDSIDCEVSILENCREMLAAKLASESFKLPVLPQVAGQVIALTGNPNSDIAELSTLIHRDQSLASHILRVANSAAYGGSQKIVSLQQAVTRLGMKSVGEIAIAISVQGEVFCVSGFEKEIAFLWRHAAASGVWGKEVAKLKRLNVEGQFLCGLLHSIGKPVALHAIGGFQKAQLEALPHESLLQLIEEVHCALGAAVAQKWNLPQQVSAACRHYRNFIAAPSFRCEVAMTSLADRLATWLIAPQLQPELPVAGDPVLTELNIYPDEFASLLERKPAVLATVSELEL